MIPRSFIAEYGPDGRWISDDESILAEAERIISGARQNAYDSPERNFERIARVWSVLLGHDVTPAQVGLCMCGLKLVRESHKHGRDNLVDLAGYAACVQQIEDGK